MEKKCISYHVRLDFIADYLKFERMFFLLKLKSTIKKPKL